MAMGRSDPFQRDRGFDLTLAGRCIRPRPAMRLETLVRTAVAEEEFEVRRRDLLRARPPLRRARRSIRHAYPRAGRSASRAPQFLALSNALLRNGAEVVGAFTAFTAFDYLHERPFDAVVL